MQYKTFRTKCDFCDEVVNVRYADLKKTFWMLDAYCNPMYSCDCPCCGNKIFISRSVLEFIKLISK